MLLLNTLITVPIFLLAISVHEYSHAVAAVRRGDPTPRIEGRLTLNPKAHLSLVGTIMLLVVGIGWANPVNVNPRNLRNPKTDMFWIALAGPMSNLALAALFSFLFHAFAQLLPFNEFGNIVWRFLYQGVWLNVVLFFFNLLPIPPLDGSKLVARFIPPRWNYVLLVMGQYGVLILFFLLNFFGLNVFLGRLTSSALHLFGLPG